MLAIQRLIYSLAYSVGLLLLIGLVACRPGEESTDASVKEDKVLAQVYNKMLYLSDMEGMFPLSCSKEDSSIIVTSFIERWVRDNVLMHQAERNIPSDLNIDELVRDYRSSLIRLNFEKNMVDILMDTLVTEAEMAAHYEKNKEQFQLSSTILRCYLIKVPKGIENMDELKRVWPGKTEEGFTDLLEFASRYADIYMLEDSSWYKVDDIAIQMPKGTITPGNLLVNKDITMEDSDFRYFFRAKEVVMAKKIAPMSYVKEQISKVILHDRKRKLLKEKKEEMYERELRKNNIKVF
ncbi:MAG: hypothetical protein ACI8YQ_001724 [Polaribacter sp.]|jgi:hypothetical protein